MDKADKLLDKMCNNPKDWHISDIETLAKRYGINVRKGKGSHVVLDHYNWIELLTIPARRPIKPIYIKKLVRLIEDMRR